ncbi:MAG: cytochrome C [Nitrospirae bacterium CG18_big_fil_WC_8_21_14_2_50_70_55]|nr:cytochrome c [Deltaproteobacteria bacterium]PIQ03813.1 MAG: cytochrome C [Nitrospirae bacterium CG18_big_fil_WC_8_21_14_2_50_70_55]PIU80170.1 MAG: cytochrome C [Nitrospirae bacterium CG06_land_8_20_14_3_00_70_43]PIX82903.1 MAG: cytochrome C [Nitrospirae bacterium CG_4_10_14_3_um_filter_70_108]PJB95577.1 MAG: cytochrome C [Nitrospirae bacterium CG_4_9_14_0_8_um_filter_70_14]HBB40229.1 cytochrome C [Pseudomonadota bacterium]
MRTTVGSLLVLLLGMVLDLHPRPAAAAEEGLVARGKAVYEVSCVICHGPKGDGKGLTGVIHRAQAHGVVIQLYPRDFTAGMFKFRTTPTGYLPTDDDLLHTITEGIPRSGMPSHQDVALADRQAVIAYIKTFSKRWQEEEAGTPVKIGKVPTYVSTAESVKRGKELYKKVGCFQCHGLSGKGDGPSSDTLKDAWGDKILPFDFTSGTLKMGSGAVDIYRTFVTGLDGTPMPSYEESLDEQQRWDIVSYCLDLMQQWKPQVVQQ